MKFKLMVVLALVFCMVCSEVIAAELTIKSGDNIPKLLEMQKGKKVTVRMQGNDELTGKVRMVTNELLHLGELAGRDFSDAAIDINKISVLIVRVKE